MSRKGMDLKEFNAVMKKCSENYKVRYVCPTIHPRAKEVVEFTIYTDEGTFGFGITNNPNEDFDLNLEVNKFLGNL
jgi:hypothetical protein